MDIFFISANTLTVCSSGCNSTTIQGAIDLANAGDAINVSAGIYNEDLIINSSKINLEIIGTNSSVIKGVSNVPIVSFPLAAPNIEILANGVKLHGFTIESPNYQSGKYSSGIVIGGSSVEIYSNNFKTTGSANSDEISQAIQTYHKLAKLGVDISGLNIHDNVFLSLAPSVAGYEGIWINLDEGFGTININNNQFIDDVFRAITTERSKTNIKNNLIITNLSPNLPGLGAWQGINIGGANNGSVSTIFVINNTIKGADSGKSFNYGIKAGYDITSTFTNLNISRNTIQNSGKAGVYAKFSASGMIVNFNNFLGNVLGVKNDDINALNAEKNYWGSCDGPSGNGAGHGDNVSANVDFTPWIGICILNLTEGNICIIENKNIELKADLTGIEINSVIFSYIVNGTNYNSTGIKGSGNSYSATIPGLILVSGNVSWKVYANDFFGNNYNSSLKSFYTIMRTRMGINFSNPDGLNGWYVTEPLFTLINTDAIKIFYKWDGTGTHNYTAPFNLTNIPNQPPQTAGILKLTWWSNVSCGIEEEQNQTLKVDLTNPVIKNLIPANNSIVYNNKKPTIQAYIDEVYGENSGVDKSSISMMVNGINVDKNVFDADTLDAVVRYNPLTDLSEGLNNVSINVTDKSGRHSELSWFFYINTSVPLFNLSIYSPENNIYGSKNVKFNLTASFQVNKIEYIDYNDKNPKFKVLCTRCSEYGYLREKKLTLFEGDNNITIRATDKFGNIKEISIGLFIDSKLPVISLIMPRKNSLANGSLFYIKYSENNLRNISLFYGNDNDFREKNLYSFCNASGKNQECFSSLDLSDYNGENILYWFNITDIARTIASKPIKIKVDTIFPNLTLSSPVSNFIYHENYRGNIPLNISLNEKSLIKYYDNSDLLPKWKILCSNCNKFYKIKKFSSGIHKLTIKATDKAGNSAVDYANFTIL